MNLEGHSLERRESKPGHERDQTHAHSPTFQLGVMLRKIGAMAQHLGSSHLPVAWTHCCCPMVFSIPSLLDSCAIYPAILSCLSSAIKQQTV